MARSRYVTYDGSAVLLVTCHAQLRGSGEPVFTFGPDAIGEAERLRAGHGFLGWDDDGYRLYR